MPALFNKLGIRFQYPENWTLETDPGAAGGKPSVSVYSPGGGFWTIWLHAGGEDPAELAQTAAEVFEREYDELDSEPVSETIAGIELIGFDLNFYCLDLINTARIRAFTTQRGTYLVICQAEDRDFDRLSDVFQAITMSLLSGK